MSIFTRFLRFRCTVVLFVALFLVFTAQLAPIAFAHNLALKAKPQPTCLQASANLDPGVLTTTQLEAYGLPLRPSDRGAQPRWLQNANRIKHDRHICNPQVITGSFAHRSSRLHASTATAHVTPSVTQYTDDAFAGNFATGSKGDYTFSSANWNLPCMNTGTTNARASFWLGLGGFGGVGYLVQAGTDVIVDGNGHVSYTAWIESTNYNDYVQTYSLPNARCGNTMYVEVDSNFEGDGSNYYIINGGGINISMGKNWPTSIGDTGECMVERLHDSSGNLYNLANFNYIAFSNCLISANGIGNLPHNYYVMTNGGLFPQEMAGPGPIANGTDYHVNWFRAS
jgi:Peptidase A4 family